MKKLIPLLLIVLISGCAPRTASQTDLMRINIVDRHGMTQTISAPDRLKKYERTDFTKPQPYQRVTRIFLNPNTQTPNSILTSYHDNGHIHQYLEAQDGRAHGLYQEWYENGKPKIKCEVIEGIAELAEQAAHSWVFHGESLAWTEQGNLQASIPYNKGRIDGESTYYHSNGAVWKKVPHLSGKRHGQVKSYLDSGEVFSIQSFSEDLPDGEWVRYWSSGRPAFREFYESGKLLNGEYWDIQGDRVSQVTDGEGWRATFGKKHLAALTEYRNGTPNGLVKEFDESQVMVRQYHLKNGEMHGLETLYYPDSQKDGSASNQRVSIHWYHGAIHGEVKSWYKNGQQESVREMSRNRKHGLATAWYEDGSLMLIEEYQENKLIRGQYLKLGDRHPISKVDGGSGTATLYDGTGAFLHRVPYRNGYPAE